MLIKCLKNVGLFLAIILLHQSLALNDTEKSPSESFVVSANYGVQSEQHKANSLQNHENSQNFVPSNQQYEGYTEDSLFVNKNYQDYSKSSLPTTQQDQNQGHFENTKQANNQGEVYLEGHSENLHSNYEGNVEILPTPSQWQAHFHPNLCTRHGVASQSSSENVAPQSYYGSYTGQSQSTTIDQSVQENPENYLNRALNRNEVVDPLPITSFKHYSPRLVYDDQNTYSNGYRGPHNNFEDVVYGSSNNEINQDAQWTGTNRKISNDRASESQNNWSPGNQVINDSNDFGKPNVVELQEMINKIVKGNSKVHQVLKVPAVYEIHLQEEEKQSGQAQINPNTGFHVPQSSPQKWQPQYSGTPQQWRKRRPPNKPRPSRNPQHGGPPGTKTWNLPPKIKYFNNRDGINDGSSYGKFPYPQPFAATESAKEIPLQRWYNSPGRNNRYSNRILPTGPSAYGSVSVPMTPGSTEVTFVDNNVNNFGHQNQIDTSLLNSSEAMPNLSHYYAKKKEIENSSLRRSNSNENAYRRDSTDGTSMNLKRNYRTNLRNREERNFLPFGNLNYIIYVREKSRA